MTEEYITIGELADRLKVKPKTVKNQMGNGTFIKGIHFFSPRGLGPRFKWSAVVAWLEEKEEQATQGVNGSRGIPMARGYTLE